MAARKPAQLLIIALVLGGIFAFFYFDLQSLLSFEELRARSDELRGLAKDNPVQTGAIFFAAY